MWLIGRDLALKIDRDLYDVLNIIATDPLLTGPWWANAIVLLSSKDFGTLTFPPSSSSRFRICCKSGLDDFLVLFHVQVFVCRFLSYIASDPIKQSFFLSVKLYRNGFRKNSSQSSAGF